MWVPPQRKQKGEQRNVDEANESPVELGCPPMQAELLLKKTERELLCFIPCD